jgi:hypothetical protein
VDRCGGEDGRLAIGLNKTCLGVKNVPCSSLAVPGVLYFAATGPDDGVMPQAVHRGLPLFLFGFWACSTGNGSDPHRETASGGSDNAGGTAGNVAPGTAGQSVGGTAGDNTVPIVTQSPDGGLPPSPRDAGTIDVAKPPGTCPYLFCEDFESSATINNKVWTVRKDATNMVGIDATNPAHGKNAVKFHAGANSGRQ